LFSRAAAILRPGNTRNVCRDRRPQNAALVEGFCWLPCFEARHVLAVLKRVNRRLADNAMGPRAVKGFGEARHPGARRSWSQQQREQQRNGSQGWIRTTDLSVNNRSLYR
jgi:hypothetical protein